MWTHRFIQIQPSIQRNQNKMQNQSNLASEKWLSWNSWWMSRGSWWVWLGLQSWSSTLLWRSWQGLQLPLIDLGSGLALSQGRGGRFWFSCIIQLASCFQIPIHQSSPTNLLPLCCSEFQSFVLSEGSDLQFLPILLGRKRYRGGASVLGCQLESWGAGEIASAILLTNAGEELD
jgi:hypothetical protein